MPKEMPGAAVTTSATMPIVVNPTASGLLKASRADPKNPSTLRQPAAAEPPGIGVGQREVARPGRRRRHRECALEDHEVREKVSARGASSDEVLCRSNVSGVAVRIACREGRDQAWIVPSVVGGSFRLQRFRHVLRETTSFDGWFPASCVPRIIAPAAWRPRSGGA